MIQNKEVQLFNKKLKHVLFKCSLVNSEIDKVV